MGEDDDEIDDDEIDHPNVDPRSVDRRSRRGSGIVIGVFVVVVVARRRDIGDDSTAMS